jgi:hypothetical protein
MNIKNKKIAQSDRIFVKSKVAAKKSSTLDDIGLLALQISCTQREEIKAEDLSDDLEPLDKFFCINMETRTNSAVVFIANYDGIELTEVIKRLHNQIYNVMKSAHEKIYILDIIEMNIPPVPFVNMFAHFGEHTFLWRTQNLDVVVSYVKLKKNPDAERFESINMDKVDEGIAPTDLYLHFPKNNRYVHYLKKGTKLEKQRRDRLHQRGIKKLFMPKDQDLDKQKLRVEAVIADFYNKYLALKKAG